MLNENSNWSETRNESNADGNGVQILELEVADTEHLALYLKSLYSLDDSFGLTEDNWVEMLKIGDYLQDNRRCFRSKIALKAADDYLTLRTCLDFLAYKGYNLEHTVDEELRVSNIDVYDSEFSESDRIGS